MVASRLGVECVAPMTASPRPFSVADRRASVRDLAKSKAIRLELVIPYRIPYAISSVRF